MEEIITPFQLAALLQVNVKTVYRLAKKGAIPGNKIGGSWRFRKKEILDLVANKQRKQSRLGRSLGQKNRSAHKELPIAPNERTEAVEGHEQGEQKYIGNISE